MANGSNKLDYYEGNYEEDFEQNRKIGPKQIAIGVALYPS